MSAIYDRIGDGYDTTRRADQQILATFHELLGVRDEGIYLDVACGTGNYTAGLVDYGGHWHAFDQSETMLAEARLKSAAVEWRKLDAELTRGLRSLSGDISSGHIYDVIDKYDNSLGDYPFIVAIKTLP